MAIIGTFTKDSAGNYNGSIRTLTLTVKQATLRRVEKTTDQAPDYRMDMGGIEFGAAWLKTSREDREYLSVKLDDPSFPAAIYATLVQADEGYSLIWSRSRQAD
jgi:uncharacterized protein (DUF736 family)